LTIFYLLFAMHRRIYYLTIHHLLLPAVLIAQPDCKP